MFELPTEPKPSTMTSKADSVGGERAVAALEALSVGVVSIWADGSPSTLNAAARRMLGASSDEVARSDAARRALDGETVTGERLVVGDRVLAIDAAPVAATSGTPAGATLTVRDVTERALDEEMGDELLGKAAHDLRTPLTALKACAQLVERGLERLEPAARTRTLALLVAQVEKLSGKIDDVLDAARIRRGRVDLEPVDLDVASELAQIAEETSKLPGAPAIDVQAEGELRAHFDRARLRQIVRGLLLEGRRPDQKAIVMCARPGPDRTVEVTIDAQPPEEDRRARTARRFATTLTKKLGGEAEATRAGMRLRLPAPRSAG